MVYPGGKNGSGVYQKIINLMPPHKVYIEPFLGSGAILRAKKPAMSSIAIDKDAGAIENFDRSDIPGLNIFQGDAFEFLRYSLEVKSKDTLVYLDPPYLLEARSSQRPIYNFELNDTQHIELLEIIKELPCMVVLSGYYSDLYANTLKDWRVETFQTVNRAGNPAIEYVWLNFPEPMELHDYRYLGNDFRERERIKRKKLRWVNRLKRLPALERYALLSAIEELGPTSP